MRVGTQDLFAVELEYQPEHTVCGRVLGTKVDCTSAVMAGSDALIGSVRLPLSFNISSALIWCKLIVSPGPLYLASRHRSPSMGVGAHSSTECDRSGLDRPSTAGVARPLIAIGAARMGAWRAASLDAMGRKLRIILCVKSMKVCKARWPFKECM